MSSDDDIDWMRILVPKLPLVVAGLTALPVILSPSLVVWWLLGVSTGLAIGWSISIHERFNRLDETRTQDDREEQE